MHARPRRRADRTAQRRERFHVRRWRRRRVRVPHCRPRGARRRPPRARRDDVSTHALSAVSLPDRPGKTAHRCPSRRIVGAARASHALLDGVIASACEDLGLTKSFRIRVPHISTIALCDVLVGAADPYRKGERRHCDDIRAVVPPMPDEGARSAILIDIRDKLTASREDASHSKRERQTPHGKTRCKPHAHWDPRENRHHVRLVVSDLTGCSPFFVRDLTRSYGSRSSRSRAIGYPMTRDRPPDHTRSNTRSRAIDHPITRDRLPDHTRSTTRSHAIEYPIACDRPPIAHDQPPDRAQWITRSRAMEHFTQLLPVSVDGHMNDDTAVTAGVVGQKGG